MALFVQGLRLFCSGASPLRPCQAYPRALSLLGFVATLWKPWADGLCPFYPPSATWRPVHLLPDPLYGLGVG